MGRLLQLKKLVISKLDHLSSLQLATIGLIGLLGLLLRLYNLGAASLSGDEAVGAIRAYWLVEGIKHLNPTNLYGLIIHSRPPSDILFSTPAFIMPLSEVTLRGPYLFFFFCTATVFCLYLTRHWGKLLGIAIFLNIMVSPMTVGWSRLSTVDSLELGYAFILIMALDYYWRNPDGRKLTILSIVYAFSFWFVDTFVLLLPLFAVLVFQALLKRYVKISQITTSAAFFVVIFATIWIPRTAFYLFDPRVNHLGVGYQLNRMTFPDILGNIGYYSQTYFPQSFAWIFITLITIGLFSRQTRSNGLFRICTAYTMLYLTFFLVIFWHRQAYLANIYIPLVIGGMITLKKLFSRRMFVLMVFGIITIQFLKTSFYIASGRSDTTSIWGFRSRDYVREAAYIIRTCTSKQELIRTNIDGYVASFYFNRKNVLIIPPLENETFSDQASAVYLVGSKQNVKVPDIYRFRHVWPDQSVLYLKNCRENKSFTNFSAREITANDFINKFWSQDEKISFYR